MISADVVVQIDPSTDSLQISSYEVKKDKNRGEEIPQISNHFPNMEFKEE